MKNKSAIEHFPPLPGGLYQMVKANSHVSFPFSIVCSKGHFLKKCIFVLEDKIKVVARCQCVINVMRGSLKSDYIN